jgi:hypothetical protein
MGNAVRQGAQVASNQQECQAHNLQALEGKDVKDLLLNVGSGGGAAAAPAAGAAPTGGAAAAEEPAAKEEEKKEEGRMFSPMPWILLTASRKGRIRRGHGLWPLRLIALFPFFLPFYIHTSDHVAHAWRIELNDRGSSRMVRNCESQQHDAEAGSHGAKFVARRRASEL